MKKLHALLLFSMFVAFATGCNLTGSDSEPGPVFLRISNTSSIDFDSVYVSFPKAESTFRDLGAGQTSMYREFEQAYHYGYIEVHSGEKEYRLVPIDYVGEKPLGGGQYTFRLNIIEGDHLTQEFIRD